MADEENVKDVPIESQSEEIVTEEANVDVTEVTDDQIEDNNIDEVEPTSAAAEGESGLVVGDGGDSEAGDGKSGDEEVQDEENGEQVENNVTVGEVGEQNVEQVDGEPVTEQTEGEQVTELGEAEQTAEQVDGEQTAEQVEGEQTAEQVEKEQTAEQADGEQTTEQAEGEQTAEQVEGEQTAEQTEGEQTAEQTEGEQTAEQVEGEQVEVKADEAEKEIDTTLQIEEGGAREDAATGTEPSDEIHETDPHAVSPRTQANLTATATVKFVLMPSGQVVTMACSLGQTLGHLKEHFAAELKVPPSVIMLMFGGRNMENGITLADLGVGPNGTVQLEMQSADPVNTPIQGYRPRQEYHMPDVISVRVQTDDGTVKNVVVEIERATKKKPYLGGYRHKNSGVEYHHASAQTMKKIRAPTAVERNCRDTQTVQIKHIVQQTTNNMSTQMTGIGVYVSNVQDKLMTPGKYTTADDYKSMLLEKIIIIQKYYRRWLAQRYVHKLIEDKNRRLEWERQEQIRKKKEKEDRIKREFERRMNPKTKEDFDLLYHALEKWRQEELEHINNTLTGAERKAALCQLLEQETHLIGSIGRHKLEADTENKQKHIQSFLEKASSPKKWRGRDGKMTEMDTPFTIRAAELKDIYNSITMKYLTQDERLDVLLTLKHTVKEHDCKLTQDIIELIDREADLLMRGVKEDNLTGLRKRISTLFLQYIKTPTFNPEVTKLLKVPQDPAQLRKNIYYCNSCNQYLPSTDFQLSSNSRNVGKCRKCQKIDNDARVRQDYSQYRYMLNALRKSEEAMGDGSKIAFLLQESDLRYLVENVWNSQSMLSAWDDLYDLVLIRWDRNEEWSPWNCILLTKDEASAHVKLENLEEGYGKVFMHKANHKHTLARNYFSRLPGMAELMHAKEKENQKSRGPSVSGQRVPIRAQ